MYTTFNPTSKRTAFELADLGIQFCAIKKQKALAELLGSNKKTLQLLLEKPEYKTFAIPKTNSAGERIIDTPCDALKTIQRILQDQLQAVYYHIRPRCTHGAIVSTSDEVRPRNLLTNARAHVGKKHFLHLDLKNFFHTVSETQVRAMFSKKPFGFSKKVAELLTQLVCYRKRLPMGTSTSGIVANFCLLDLDTALQSIANQHDMTYTRFIDDLTFSSKKSFSKSQIESIRSTIKGEGYIINDDKMKVSIIDDQPEITGLVIMGGKVDVKEEYVKQLEADVKLYEKVVQKHHHQARIFPAGVLQHFKNHLNGQLAFVRYVRGKDSLVYIRLVKRMKNVANGVRQN